MVHWPGPWLPDAIFLGEYVFGKCRRKNTIDRVQSDISFTETFTGKMSSVSMRTGVGKAINHALLERPSPLSTRKQRTVKKQHIHVFPGENLSLQENIPSESHSYEKGGS